MISILLLISFVFFILGLIIGSFLNVVICRLNTKKSFGGRSACMSCQYNLAWYDLVPLFSFLALKGRCRTCQTRISHIYPLVEVITGLIFVILFFKFQDLFLLSILDFVISYLYYASMFSILMIVAVYDLRHKIIPDTLVFLFGILAFFGLFIFNNSYGFFPHIPSLLEFLSGILVALPFALLWLVSRGAWMGLGDAKLILGLGWLLGFPAVLSALVLAFFSGALTGLGLIFFSKIYGWGYGMKSEIPFAIYLVGGAFVAFVLQLNFFAVGF